MSVWRGDPTDCRLLTSTITIVTTLDDPYAGAFVLQDEEALCAKDRRFRFSEVTLGPGSCDRIAMVWVKDVSALSTSYRAQIGVDKLEGPAVFIGGGLAQFRIGLELGDSKGANRRRFGRLIRKAILEAEIGNAHPIIPFLASADLSVVLAEAPVATVQALEPWCFFRIENGARDLEAAISGLDRKRRQTWTRDLRDCRELGLSFSIAALDDDAIDAAVSSVSLVSARNGLSEPAVLTAWRLRGFRERPGDHIVVRTHQEDRVVAHTLCRIWKSTSGEPILDAHTVGVEETGLTRRSIYHAGAYVGPLVHAAQIGCSRLDLGYAHSQPKLARGSTGIDMVRVDLSPAGLRT